MMDLHKTWAQAQKMVSDNSPAILTALGVTGALATAVMVGKASFEASDVLRAESKRVNADAKSMDEVYHFTPREKFEKVWVLYIPAVVTATFTCTAIIFANRIGTRRTAAMATALTISDRAYVEYKEKVVEQIGKNKEKKVRDEIAQDRVTNHPTGRQPIIVTGGGESLCYDKQTDRYFNSSVEKLLKGQNDINYILIHEGFASLNEFYSKIDMPHVPYGEDIGWTSDKLVEVLTTATISDDGRPCIVMDFANAPVQNFFRKY